MKIARRTRWVGYAYLLPAAVLIALFSVIPFFWNFYLSFQKWSGFGEPEFVALQNYISTFTNPQMRSAFLNSLLYADDSTLGGVVLGILFAVLIFRLSSREGSVFRLILYSPAMLPTAVVGIMFVFFFNPEMGLLNSFLKLIGLESLQHVWLQEKSTAMACIIFVAIWKCAGSVMMLVFAAMQGIPSTLYESSYLDGATFIQQLTRITFPLIKPMLMLATINTLGVQFKSYDLVFTMTQGGPGTLTATVPILMKKMAFSFGSFGSAAAAGALFTVAVAVSLLLVRAALRGEDYEY